MNTRRCVGTVTIAGTYGISDRELEEMMGERDVAVDHTTLYRWTQRYAPELEKRSAWYHSRLSFS